MFDEYVQARADELIAQREHLLHTDDVKNFITWSVDFQNTLSRVSREATNNHPTDFKTGEIALQAFINRWVDPAVGLKFPNAVPNYGLQV